MNKVILVAAAAVVMIGGGACSAPSAEVSSSPPPAAPKSTTKFTAVPDACELLERETLAKYAPEAACRPGAEDDRQTVNDKQEPIIRRGPRWEPAHTARQGKFHATVEVNLTLGLDTYAEDQESAQRSISGSAVGNERPVAGIGDEASLYYGVGDKQGHNGNLARGILVSRWGNVSLRVFYWHYQAAASDDGLSEQQVLKALKAITRDVYDDLS